MTDFFFSDVNWVRLILVFLSFDSIWVPQPIAHVLRSQMHGVGRERFGLSSSTLREIPNSKVRFIRAVRIAADLLKSD